MTDLSAPTSTEASDEPMSESFLWFRAEVDRIINDFVERLNDLQRELGYAPCLPLQQVRHVTQRHERRAAEPQRSKRSDSIG